MSDIDLNSIKAFLENNRIFFEIFSWVGVGAMSIVLSTVALLFMRRQSALIKQQTIIMERDAELQRTKLLPQIKIRRRQVVEDESARINTEYCEIDNEGEPLSNFNGSMFTFFVTEKMYFTAQRKVAWTPIVDYFGAHYVSGNTRGRLSTSLWKGNFDAFFRIYQKFVDLKDHDGFYLFDKKTFAKVVYDDTLGSHHRKYFLLSGLHDQIELANYFGEEVERFYNQQPRLDIDHVTFEEIKKYFDDHMGKEPKPTVTS